MQKEKSIHQGVCDFISFQYPNVIYTSDASGLRVGLGIRNELKRKRCKKYKIPDLLILQPSKRYKGLFIEIKSSKSDVYTQSGFLKNNEHIKMQHKTIVRLNELGYCAVFGCGLFECISIIKNYMHDVLPG